MANILFCKPNYIKSDFNVPVIGGGDWRVEHPLTNLRRNFFIDSIISTDAQESSTIIDFDFTVPREIRAIIIHNSNVSLSGNYQFQVSNSPSWETVTVDGANSSGSSSLKVVAGTVPAGMLEGDIFTIAGDSTIYKVTTDLALNATGMGTLSITPSLANNLTGGEEVTCHSGDFSPESILHDSGISSFYDEIYPIDSGFTWGDPRIWTGTESEEELQTVDVPRPVVDVLQESQTAQYVRVKVLDAGNVDGFVEIEKIYITGGIQPQKNASYGANQLLKSNTSREEGPGGAAVFNREQSQRFVEMEFRNMTVDSSFATIFDMQREQDINEDFYFVFDPDDTTLLSRRSFAAYFDRLSGIQYDAYDHNSSRVLVREKLA